MTITIGNVVIHVESKDGHISLHTDWHPTSGEAGKTMSEIITALRSLQDDDERELDCLRRPGGR